MGAIAGLTSAEGWSYRGRALALIAGEDTYHDLIAAGEMLRTAADAAGFDTHLGVGLQRFREPAADTSAADVYMLYTFGALFPTAEQEALASLVRDGRGLVAVHCTNTLRTIGNALDPDERPTFELLGSRFVRHPADSGRHRIEVVSGHPVTDGVDGFETRDEYYELELADDAIVPLASRQRVEGERYPAGEVPVMYAREVGHGRVVYLALGHDERGWSEPAFGALLRRAIRWTARDTTRA
jgi:type 1 glutamine amidotransferase